MPERSYTGVNLINYTVTDNLLDQVIGPGGTASCVATPFSQAIVTVFGQGQFTSNTTDYVQATVVGSYAIDANFDFDVFPAIPDNAVITQIEVKANFSCTGSADITPNSNAGSATISGSMSIGNAAFGLFNDLTIVDNQSSGVVIPISFNSSVPPPSSQIIDLSGSPINKSQLISDWGDIFILLQPLISISTPGPPVVNLTGSSFVSLVVDNIEFIVTYHEGPLSVMTVTPAGGDVQRGQILVVTGPGVAEEDFFFETEDGIIPVEPQIISEDEVWIELPYPATDPCFDCFPECPDCEAAFAPCDADFSSEACQEAMQECLDCLTECLEDLQEAEECQESSHNPPNVDIPVDLIVGTQFRGNVPLGSFTILNADGSGLYRFTLGQTHDTLYDGARDGTTYNVKIPNPGGKTGFFRS